jgi:hypothetical protein
MARRQLTDSFKPPAPGRPDDGHMTSADFDAAAQFLAGTGRVLDRRRFGRLFGTDGPAPVRDAVAAYRNSDGGFGQALEPDGRCPGSQPLAIALALATLDEAGAWDDDLVQGACGWLQLHAPAAGGVAEADPCVRDWPHAPWWASMDDEHPSIITTGLIAGTLQARRVRHPWLDRATELEWAMIGELTTTSPYQMRAVMHFLDRVPDRDRAVKAFGQCGPLILDQDLVALDPDAPGEIHTPLDFAPLPSSLGRRLFRPEVIEAHLDHLAAAQQADGGWMFNWPAWSPAATADWRGSITVDALRLLGANGRA